MLGPGVLLRFGAGGEATRTGFYAASMRMFADAPLLGQGPGTWPMRRIEYTLPTETDYNPHAHNIYLQTLAELGIVGVLAGVVVLVYLSALIWQGVRDLSRTSPVRLGSPLCDGLLRSAPAPGLLREYARGTPCLRVPDCVAGPHEPPAAHQTANASVG